jgi:hypothetical protein
MSYIILRGRWSDFFLYVHVAAEDKLIRGTGFKYKLECAIDKFPKYRTKITKVGKEYFLKPTVWK